MAVDDAVGTAPGVDERLQAFVGHDLGGPNVARDPVNQPMIRHWCDAMGDRLPAYTDPEAAAASLHRGIVAPPTMLQAWTMRGLVPPTATVGGAAGPAGYSQAELNAVLDEAGCTSVVATNCEQEYHRYLRLGDLLTERVTVESISPLKRTGLGEGHFVTTLRSYHDQEGALVGEMRFRLLRYRPGTGRVDGAGSAGVGAGAATGEVPWPLPAVNRDTAFFWEGTRLGELRVQRCTSCGRLRHPPTPSCPTCGSLSRDWIVAAGTGTVYSYVVHHHPPVPPLELPFVVAVVALDEGTRIVGNVVGVDPADVTVGLPVEVVFVPVGEGVVLPQWRPRSDVGAGTTAGTGDAARVATVGARLAPLEVPITPTLIVAGAIASRDYQDVHHDHDGAIGRGSPDIFMNILTTNGLVGRYVTDWAGPDAVLRSVHIRLGAPNYPGDTMRLTGEVTDRQPAEDSGGGDVLTLSITGSNRLGDHVVGTVRVTVPGGTGGAA